MKKPRFVEDSLDLKRHKGKELRKALQKLIEAGKVSQKDVEAALAQNEENDQTPDKQPTREKSGVVLPPTLVVQNMIQSGVKITFSDLSDVQTAPDFLSGVLPLIQARFFNEKHLKLHPNVLWEDFEIALKNAHNSHSALRWMEESGGEPDVVSENDTHYALGDCFDYAPQQRRLHAYDEDAEKAIRWRKNCLGSAGGVARKNRVLLMPVDIYEFIDGILELDRHSWAWLFTSQEIRQKGSGIRADYNQGKKRIFSYPANEYEGTGAFRTVLWIPKMILKK